MIGPQAYAYDPYDPRHCPVCGGATKCVRLIARTFQDDLEVWECAACGASLSQTANLAKLMQQARGSMHLN